MEDRGFSPQNITCVRWKWWLLFRRAGPHWIGSTSGCHAVNLTNIVGNRYLPSFFSSSSHLVSRDFLEELSMLRWVRELHGLEVVIFMWRYENYAQTFPISATRDCRKTVMVTASVYSPMHARDRNMQFFENSFRFVLLLFYTLQILLEIKLKCFSMFSNNFLSFTLILTRKRIFQTFSMLYFASLLNIRSHFNIEQIYKIFSFVFVHEGEH